MKRWGKAYKVQSCIDMFEQEARKENGIQKKIITLEVVIRIATKARSVVKNRRQISKAGETRQEVGIE